MALSDLILTLRSDVADPDGKLFSDVILGRCILKGVYQVARDVGLSLSVVNGEIVPEPGGEALELLLILAQIHACQVMRAATASAFSFSSGDKQVDKTGQPGYWANLEKDLRAQYKETLDQMKPGTTIDPEEYIMGPFDIGPQIYEQGLDLEPLV